ncbi:HIS7, partial [Symbiodinium necroappetens]
ATERGDVPDEDSQANADSADLSDLLETGDTETTGPMRPQAQAVTSAAARLTMGGEDETGKKRRKKESKETPLALEDAVEEDGAGKGAAEDLKQLKEDDPDMFEVASKHAELSRSSGKLAMWWQLRVPLAFRDDFDGRNITGAPCLLGRDA